MVLLLAGQIAPADDLPGLVDVVGDGEHPAGVGGDEAVQVLHARRLTPVGAIRQFTLQADPSFQGTGVGGGRSAGCTRSRRATALPARRPAARRGTRKTCCGTLTATCRPAMRLAAGAWRNVSPRCAACRE